MEVCQYLRLLFRMEPSEFFIPFEPCHLLARVDAGVLLDLLNGKRQCPFTVQILEYLFITDRIQRVKVLVWIDTACLFHQSVFYHLVHPAVDAFVEFFPVTCQSDLDDAERTFFFFAGYEKRYRPFLSYNISPRHGSHAWDFSDLQSYNIQDPAI